MKNRDTKRKGAVAPLVAILMILLIGCLALVVDLGHQHNVKVELQRAVDAAALAGARELDGNAGEYGRAIAAAVTTAGENSVNGDTLLLTSSDITVGSWEIGAYDKTAQERFTGLDSTAPSENLTAVKVSRKVDDAGRFFAKIWSNAPLSVSADAIAVVTYEVPTIPIAILSCEPFQGMGYSVCDIKMYKNINDTDDTAGWSSLTLPSANAADIKYLFTKQGQQDLKTILEGLESKDVDPVCDTTKNHGTDIGCGLGPEFDSATALYDKENPITAYETSLPRWDDGLPFQRVLTINGFLEQGGWSEDKTGTVYEDEFPHYTETETSYKERLFALYTASKTGAYSDYTYSTLPTWVTDGSVDFTNYITDKNGKAPKDANDIFVHSEAALKDAGYPLVNANNGLMTSVIDTLLNDPDVGIRDPDTGNFRSDYVGKNPPFEGDTLPNGETLAAVLPVIYAGQCGEDGWKALGSKIYIGQANFYITRVWKGVNDCTDVAFVDDSKGERPVKATSPYPVCSPPLTVDPDGDLFSCIKLSAGTDKGIEGIIQPKSNNPKVGIRKISLVE